MADLHLTIQLDANGEIEVVDQGAAGGASDRHECFRGGRVTWSSAPGIQSWTVQLKDPRGKDLPQGRTPFANQRVLFAGNTSNGCTDGEVLDSGLGLGAVKYDVSCVVGGVTKELDPLLIINDPGSLG